MDFFFFEFSFEKVLTYNDFIYLLTGNPLSLALLNVETDFLKTVARKASCDGLCL